jgi:hypothetical protein
VPHQALAAAPAGELSRSAAAVLPPEGDSSSDVSITVMEPMQGAMVIEITGDFPGYWSIIGSFVACSMLVVLIVFYVFPTKYKWFLSSCLILHFPAATNHPGNIGNLLQ